MVVFFELLGCHDRLHSNGVRCPQLSRYFADHAAPNLKASCKFTAYGHARRGPKRGLTSLMRPLRPLPGSCSWRKPLRGGPNVNLSDRCGSLRRWFHFHLSTVRDGTLGIGISADADNLKVVPMMRLVKCLRLGAPSVCDWVPPVFAIGCPRPGSVMYLGAVMLFYRPDGTWTLRPSS
jgi:hypothetical protein